MEAFAIVLTITMWTLIVITTTLLIASYKDRKPRADNNKYSVVRFERVGDEWQAELTDSQIYRSCEEGIVWYRYPDGACCDVDLESSLEEQLEAHKRRLKWGVEEPEQEDRDGPRVH